MFNEENQNTPIVLEEKHIDIDSYLNAESNHWITVLNPLLLAIYDLDLYPFKMLMFTLTTVSSVNDDKLYSVTVPVSKLSKVIGINSKNASALIEKACDQLMDAKIKIKDIDNDEWIKIHLMQHCYKRKGKVTLALSLEMSKYVLKLQKNFTKIPFFYINKLHTVYANRLFLVLYFHFMREYNQMKTLEAKDKCNFQILYSVEYLYSFFLGENKENKYKKYNDFYKRVIKSSIDDINESLLLNIRTSFRSEGKRVTKINFIIRNGEANKAYLDTMQNNKEKRIAEEATRKIDGSAKSVVTYLQNIFHIRKEFTEEMIATYDLKTVELKAICIFMQQFLDKKELNHFWGLKNNNNEYLYYYSPSCVDAFTIGHGMALLRIIASNKELEILKKVPLYNHEIDYEENLKNLAFADSINKKFAKVYNKHIEVMKELYNK